MDRGLVVLSVVLGLSAVTSSVVAHRALGPYRHVARGLPRAPEDATAALRSSALTSLVALVAAVAVAAVTAVLVTAASWELMIAVLVIPMASTMVGLAVYAAVPVRPAPPRVIATAFLTPRRPGDDAPRMLAVLCVALAAVLLVLLVAASVQDTVFLTAQTWGLAVAAVADAGVTAAAWCALRRVADQPALPREMQEVDRTIRGSASRLVLLLTASALLASTATVTIALGYATTSRAALAAADGSPNAFLAVLGTGSTVAGVVAVIGALGGFVAAVTASVSLARATMSLDRAPRPASVSA